MTGDLFGPADPPAPASRPITAPTLNGDERVTLLVRDMRTRERRRMISTNPPRMAGRDRWRLHQRALPGGVRLEAIIGEGDA